jgi:acyl-CoA thioester hydrolase
VNELSVWETAIPLRPQDIDSLGHLTAVAYMPLFERARWEWLSYVSGDPSPSYVLAYQQIRYEREVLLDDSPVRIAVQLDRIGRQSLTLSETLATAAGEIGARSGARLVSWDQDARRARPLTPDEQARFQPRLAQR